MPSVQEIREGACDDSLKGRGDKIGKTAVDRARIWAVEREGEQNGRRRSRSGPDSPAANGSMISKS